MPKIGGGFHAFAQHALRAVFAALEFVAYDGHFGVEDLFGEFDVHHAVGFEAECPLQIFIGGGNGFVIIGAVGRGGPVPGGAAAYDFVFDLAAVGGLDEVHVFEEVGHAGLTVA